MSIICGAAQSGSDLKNSLSILVRQYFKPPCLIDRMNSSVRSDASRSGKTKFIRERVWEIQVEADLVRDCVEQIFDRCSRGLVFVRKKSPAFGVPYSLYSNSFREDRD